MIHGKLNVSIVMQQVLSTTFLFILNLVLLCWADQLQRNETSIINQQSRALLNLMEESGPIISVDLKEMKGGYICEAKSLIPVKYEVFKLWSIGQNEVEIKGRTALVNGESARVVIGCEVTAVTSIKSYKTSTYEVVNFGDIKIIVPDRLEIEDGFLKYNYYHVAYYHICIDSTESEVFNRLSKNYCLSNGYEDGSNLQYDLRHRVSTAYRMRCTNELTFRECYYNNRILDKVNIYNNDCRYAVKPQCTGDPYNSKTQLRLVTEQDLTTHLSIHPGRQLEENDNVTVTCSTTFSLLNRKRFNLQLLNFKGETVNLLESMRRDITFNLTHMNARYNYIATRDRIQDTFICSVTDLLSLTSSPQSRKTLRYKMSFNKISYRVFTVNQSAESPQFIDITGDTSQYYSADRLECQADSEHPAPRYQWTYINKIGEEKTVVSKYLNLTHVERRVPMFCQVRQEMLADTFTRSINITLTDFLELNGSAYEEIKVTVCDKFDWKQKISCSMEEDLLIKSVYVAYFNNCSANIEQCKLPMAADFIRNERCNNDKTECKLALSIIKKRYFKFIMKEGLPSVCVAGKKPMMEVKYFCIKKLSGD